MVFGEISRFFFFLFLVLNLHSKSHCSQRERECTVFAGQLIPLPCCWVHWVPCDALGTLFQGVTPSLPNLQFDPFSFCLCQAARAQEGGSLCGFWPPVRPSSFSPSSSSLLLVSVCLSHQKKPPCCKKPGPGVFPSPGLGLCMWGKAKQATNLIWFLFSTRNSFSKKRSGEASGRDLVWCCSKTGALRLGKVHFWFTAASRELESHLFVFPFP